MTKITVTLTRTEADHILSLMLDNEREGSYYGNKEQYWKRHSRIAQKFEEAEK